MHVDEAGSHRVNGGVSLLLHSLVDALGYHHHQQRSTAIVVPFQPRVFIYRRARGRSVLVWQTRHPMLSTLFAQKATSDYIRCAMVVRS
jgi:hypothetical protein